MVGQKESIRLGSLLIEWLKWIPPEPRNKESSIHVVSGTDTYGRVKTVSGTPIVTKFAMLQLLPIYPIQSFYSTGSGPTETTGIPFLASTKSVPIHGFPLASLDLISVLLAYVRAACGLFLIVDFIAGMMFLVMGQPPGGGDGAMGC
jgi:hypothetical protein